MDWEPLGRVSRITMKQGKKGYHALGGNRGDAVKAATYDLRS